eukprot:scaffold23957_cov56-Attheya_sp.AAC.3
MMPSLASPAESVAGASKNGEDSSRKDASGEYTTPPSNDKSRSETTAPALTTTATPAMDASKNTTSQKTNDDTLEAMPEKATMDQTNSSSPKKVATSSSSSSTTKKQFFAVRCGKASLRRCIFLSWEDCRTFVETADGNKDDDNIEYDAFDSFQQAIAFIEASTDASNKVVFTHTKRQLSSSSVPPSLNEAKSEGVVENVPRAKVIGKKAAVIVPAPETKQATNSNNPHKKRQDGNFERMYKKLVAFHAEHRHSRVPTVMRLVDPEMYELSCWVEGQRKRMLEHERDGILMRANRYERLRALGLSKSKFEIRWEAMFAEFKQYNDTEGTCVITKPPANSTESAEEDQKRRVLYRWVSQQRADVKLFSTDPTDEKRKLSDDRCKRLLDLGFIVDSKRKKEASTGGGAAVNPTPNILLKRNERFNEMFKFLCHFKREHGNFDVSERFEADPTSATLKRLNRWVSIQRMQLKLFHTSEEVRITKKTTLIITEEQVEKLLGIGFGLDEFSDRKALDRTHGKTWEQMYEELTEYHREHGHSRVPYRPSTPLRQWILKQQTEYSKLREAKPSLLTAARMQKLNDLGFVFTKNANPKFEERFEDLVEFHAKHGHCRPPRSDPSGLGKWVQRQRELMDLHKEGKKTPLSQERIDKLNSLGFQWRVVARPKDRVKPQPWETRFQQLLDFKEKHGHTIVPQHLRGLGLWVHDQRVSYKQMQKGQSSRMTPERALKLTEIGFVFEVKGRKNPFITPESGLSSKATKANEQNKLLSSTEHTSDKDDDFEEEGAPEEDGGESGEDVYRNNSDVQQFQNNYQPGSFQSSIPALQQQAQGQGQPPMQVFIQTTTNNHDLPNPFASQKRPRTWY